VLILFICISSWRISTSFVWRPVYQVTSSASALSMLAEENKDSPKLTGASVLIKKSKRKLVSQLEKDIEDLGIEHPVEKFLQTGERPQGVGDPKDFYNTTKVMTGTLSVFVEFNRKAKTGFMVGMPPPEIVGGVLRDAGARAIIVSVDPRSGGSSPEDFERFTKEQTRARIFMPPPICIVWNDIIIDKVQIAYAATLGAAAIVLNPDMCDDIAQLNAFVKYSQELGMEPVVLIRDVEQGTAALESGARFLCMHTLEESVMLKLKEDIDALPVSADKEVMYCARLRPESDFSTYSEIDLAWVLRDHGFSNVWPSTEAIFAQGMRDIFPAIAGMRAKASRIYLSPRQYLMDRQNEGAKEYLGDILY